MACYITDLTSTEVTAVMATFAPRREVYDNAYVTARFGAGAQGACNTAMSRPATITA